MNLNKLRNQLEDSIIGRGDIDGVQSLPKKFYIVDAQVIQDLLDEL